MQKFTQFFLVAYLLCTRYFSKTQCKPAKKRTGQCFSTEVKATCTHSANLERETEITKIVTYPLFPLASSNVSLKKPHIAPSMLSISISMLRKSHNFLIVDLVPLRHINADLRSAHEVLARIHEIVLA